MLMASLQHEKRFGLRAFGCLTEEVIIVYRCLLKASTPTPNCGHFRFGKNLI